MSDLLAIGRSGVLAYRDALSTVSENVVNADTAGFAKRKITLREQSAAGDAMSLNRTRSALSGVNAVDVQRVWDQYKATSAWSASSDAAQADTRAQWLSTTESMLDDGNTGVGTKLTSLFTSATALAANPTNSTLRRGMLSALGGATDALAETGNDLKKLSASAGARATELVQKVNDDVTALARINTSLRASAPGTSARAQLQDQRDSLIASISTNLSVSVDFSTSGAATLRLDSYSGAELLSGVTPDTQYVGVDQAVDGKLSLTLTSMSGVKSSAAVTSGALAGLFSGAATISDRRQQVDDLAGQLVTTVNTWQTGGLDALGVVGGDLMTGTTAADIAVTVTNPDKIAAATALVPATATSLEVPASENGNLLAFGKMRSNDGLEANWRKVVTNHALLVSSAKTQATAAAAQKEGTATALDEVSGVDLDTEAADLLRFQQAYSASAKIIQTARDTFSALLALF